MEAHLVGRDEELAVLKQTFQRVQAERRPALVTVVGPAGVGKSRLVARARALRRRPAGVRLLASRAVPGLRQHVVLGARRRDQGAVRDLRRRPRRGGREEGRRRRPRAVRRRRARPADPRARGRGRATRASAGRTCSRRGGGSSSGWRRATRWCSCSRTSTGPTTDSWTSSNTSPTGRRGRSWSSPSPGPSCSRPGRPGAAASATPPRSTWTRSRPTRARRCSPTCSPADLTPDLSATIVERSEGNPLYVEEIVRKLIDDGVLRATERRGGRWRARSPTSSCRVRSKD